jgi:hypothetical protein
MTYMEMTPTFNAFYKAAWDKYGHAAYSSGFLQSLLMQVLEDVPASKRNSILRMVDQTTVELVKSTSKPD